MATSHLSFSFRTQKKVVRLDSWSQSGIFRLRNSCGVSIGFSRLVWIRWTRVTLLEGIVAHFAEDVCLERQYLLFDAYWCWGNEQTTMIRMIGNDARESSAGPSCSASVWLGGCHDIDPVDFSLMFAEGLPESKISGFITHNSCRETEWPEPSKASLTKTCFCMQTWTQRCV